MKLAGWATGVVFAIALVEGCSGSVQTVPAGDGGRQGPAACGAAGDACCNATACNAGLTCIAGLCTPDTVGTSSGSGSASSGSSSGRGPGSSGGSSGANPPGDSGSLADVTPAPGPCAGGDYTGTLTGTYSSHLTTVGLPIPIEGAVHLTLDQAGTAQQTCTLQGESEACSNVFLVRNGNVTGALDGTTTGDATVGGSPFFCTITGLLDCARGVLVDGWIQCTYCLGPLAEGGATCAALSGVGGTGVGGQFAGVLTAQYVKATASLMPGAWNASEALGGNDGGSPGPDGGPPASYLSDSGTYTGPGNYGGSGSWSAKGP